MWLIIVFGCCVNQSIRWRHPFWSPWQTHASENCRPVCTPPQQGWGGKTGGHVWGVKIIITPIPFTCIENGSCSNIGPHPSCHPHIIMISTTHCEDNIKSSWHHHHLVVTSSWNRHDIMMTWVYFWVWGACADYPGEIWRMFVSKQRGDGLQR